MRHAVKQLKTLLLWRKSGLLFTVTGLIFVGLIWGFSKIIVAPAEADLAQGNRKEQFVIISAESSSDTVDQFPRTTQRVITDTLSPVDEKIPVPSGCVLDGQLASPNGRWVNISVNCGHTAYDMILDATMKEINEISNVLGMDGAVLNWSPDGNTAILRIDPIGQNEIVLANLETGSTERLDTPPETYDVAISPTNQRVLYTVSRGLGWGGELWMMNRDGSHRQLLLKEPKHLITYPVWSPQGDAIAYIRMKDTNIPFTVGELCLADGDGQNPRVLAKADTGHGYPPVWSPDGEWVAFVVRENPQNLHADLSPTALESNIYLAHRQTGAIQPLTTFTGTLVEGAVWSPMGDQLAFQTIQKDVRSIWVTDIADGEMQRVTQGAEVAYPVWLKKEE